MRYAPEIQCTENLERMRTDHDQPSSDIERSVCCTCAAVRNADDLKDGGEDAWRLAQDFTILKFLKCFISAEDTRPQAGQVGAVAAIVFSRRHWFLAITHPRVQYIALRSSQCDFRRADCGNTEKKSKKPKGRARARPRFVAIHFQLLQVP